MALLFGRDAPPPARIVVVWNLGSEPWTSPLEALAADPYQGDSRITEVRLRREHDTVPLCVIEAVRRRDAPDLADTTPSLGLLQIQSAARQPAALRIAMALLEASHCAVLRAGNADTATVQAALTGLLRHQGARAWRGGARVWLHPGGDAAHPGLPATLRWPPDLVIRTDDPDGWTHGDRCAAPWQHLAAWAGFDTAPASPHDTASPGASTAPCHPLIETELTPKKAARTPTDVHAHRTPAAATRPRRGPAPDVAPSAATAPAGTDAALALITQAPGAMLAALVDGRDGQVLARHGGGDGLERIAALASALAQAHAAQPGAETLHELSWSSALCHHLVLPLRQHPGLLLLTAVDREFGDTAAARWHLALARNQLG